MIELRDYQREGVDRALAELEQVRTTLVVMPTGTGKTILFAAIAERFRARGRVLVLVHREELAAQAVDKISRSTALTCGVEMGASRVWQLMMPDVVVASVQTLARAPRREVFGPGAFSLIIVDEAHHATSASYRKILEYFAAAKVLGVTATPDRGDKVGLRAVFESVAFTYPIQVAIKAGWLVPIRQRAVRVDGLDLSQVRITAGDLNAGDLEKIFLEEKALHEVAVPLLEQASDRRTVVFCPTVAHAHALAAVLCRYTTPDQARALDGETDTAQRKATLAAFTRGDFRYLVNCALFTEGWDEPAVGCVAVARPTKSRALYTQMIGRGTRPSPATGKVDLLVLDFVGNAGRHSLVSAIDVLAGEDVSSIQKQLAARKLEQQPELDVQMALDLAGEELERSRLATEEAARKAAARAKVKYSSEEVDPFGVGVSEVAQVLGVELSSQATGGVRATTRQLEVLGKFGVDLEAISKHDASLVLYKLFQRVRSVPRLATYKQLRLLSRRGIDAKTWTFEEASAQIEQLMSKWRGDRQHQAAQRHLTDAQGSDDAA